MDKWIMFTRALAGIHSACDHWRDQSC